MAELVLLFDLDGTLYPSSFGTEREIIPSLLNEVAALLEMDAAESKDLVSRMSRLYGYSIRGLVEENLVEDPAALVERIYANIGKPKIRRNDELAEVFANLDQNYQVAILTNSSRGHAEEVLGNLGVRERVDRIFGIQDVGYTLKPERSVYLDVARALDCDPVNFVYFDDSIRNLHAAWKMGSRCVLVANGMAESPYFWENHMSIKHLPPEHIESTFDLPEFLRQTFSKEC